MSFHDNIEEFIWEDVELHEAFAQDMQREPEDEQELIDWYEAKASSLL